MNDDAKDALASLTKALEVGMYSDVDSSHKGKLLKVLSQLGIREARDSHVLQIDSLSSIINQLTFELQHLNLMKK